MMQNNCEPHCGNCDYYFGMTDDPFGVCEIDLGDVVPTWGWCPAWATKEEGIDEGVATELSE